MIYLFFVFLGLALCQTPHELDNNKTCAHYGFDDTAKYRAAIVLPNLYNNRYDGELYSSQDLTTYNDAVTSVVIVIHGLLGDANTYFCLGMNAAQDPKTIVVAPWFGDESVTSEYWTSESGFGEVIPRNILSKKAPGIVDVHSAPKKSETLQRNPGSARGFKSLLWNTRWISGGDNSPEPARYITAFDCLDTLLSAFSTGVFPNLDMITISGFSAGAQLLHRYSFFSPLTAPVPVRIIISDPSTYLYLDEKRAVPTCVPLRDTGDKWTCQDFVVPPYNNVTACLKYDSYRWGLENLAESENLYIKDLTQGQVNTCLDEFPRKDVRWIFGVQDVCNCDTEGFQNPEFCYHPDLNCSASGCCDTFPDATVNMLNVKCEAEFTGTNRLQRGLVYMSYLAYFFEGYQPTWDVFQGGHDSHAFLVSPAFQKWITEF